MYKLQNNLDFEEEINKYKELSMFLSSFFIYPGFVLRHSWGIQPRFDVQIGTVGWTEAGWMQPAPKKRQSPKAPVQGN